MELAKKVAAIQAIKDHLTSSTKVIGIGSGSTIVYAVQYLAELKPHQLIACIPTSFQAEQLILQHHLPLADLNQYPNIQVTFDGADEVDSQLNLIKGGGGCLLQEKIVASASQKLIIIADETKKSKLLCTQWSKGIPIEVLPFAHALVSQKIAKLGGTSTLRTGSGKAGPVVTDNGNFILDAHFKDLSDPAGLDLKLQMIPGIIETGLFCGLAHQVYFGNVRGDVEMIS